MKSPKYFRIKLWMRVACRAGKIDADGSVDQGRHIGFQVNPPALGQPEAKPGPIVNANLQRHGQAPVEA